MNDTIFENAKFGDKFKTRDGQMAVLLKKFDNEYLIATDKKIYFVSKEGNDNYESENTQTIENDSDIISIWSETQVDEEKEMLKDRLDAL